MELFLNYFKKKIQVDGIRMQDLKNNLKDW